MTLHQMPTPELPVAYQEGSVEFFGRKFFVDSRTLVPRLETESLVRLAKRWIAEKKIGTVVDVGTGSGIIALTLALECAGSLARVHATDISLDALEVAQTNRKALGPDCDFWQGDLLEPILSAGSSFVAEGPVLLVANLPYIRQGDPRVGADVAAHEPALALYGGAGTGWEIYERFFLQAREFARAHPGNPVSVLTEQADDQEAIARERLAVLGLEAEFFPDLSGARRFCGVVKVV